MKEILGKKIGMTRVYRANGEAVSVTVIEAGPCPVVSKRTAEKHGYSAYQVGFGVRKKSRTNKPLAGIFAKSNLEPTQFLREIRYDENDLEIGALLKVGIFKEGEFVDVTGITRGLGFAGVMKLHNFGGGPITHGQSDRQRAPGSVGASSYPSRTFRGQRMAGKMGKERQTTLKLEVIRVMEEQNLLLVKGAVPGHRGSLVKVRITNRGRKSR